MGCSVLALVLTIGGIGQFLMWSCVLYEWVPGQQTQRPSNCIRCRYDLSGLDESPVCPECGTHNTPQPVGKTLEFQSRRASLVPLIAIASVALASAPSVLAHFILAMEIRLLGYSWSVAHAYAARHAHAENGMWHIVAIYAIALAPLLTLSRSRRRAVAAAIVFIIAYLGAFVITRP